MPNYSRTHLKQLEAEAIYVMREVAAQTDYYRAEVALYLAMGTNLERYNILAALPHEGAMP